MYGRVGQLLAHSRAVPVTTPSELLHRVGRGASTRRRGGTHDPRWHRRPDPHHHLAHHHLLSDLDRAPARTRPGLRRVAVVRPPFTGIAHAVLMSDTTLDRRSFLRYGAIVTRAAGGGRPRCVRGCAPSRPGLPTGSRRAPPDAVHRRGKHTAQRTSPTVDRSPVQAADRPHVASDPPDAASQCARPRCRQPQGALDDLVESAGFLIGPGSDGSAQAAVRSLPAQWTLPARTITLSSAGLPVSPPGSDTSAHRQTLSGT